MLVEDDESLRHVLDRELSRMGFEVAPLKTLYNKLYARKGSALDERDP